MSKKESDQVLADELQLQPFCGDFLWNRTLFLDEVRDPLLDECFENVVLRLVPCLILILLSPMELVTRRGRDRGEWRAVSVSRIVFTVCGAVLQLAEFFYFMDERRWQSRPLVTSLTPLLVFLSYGWATGLLFIAKVRASVRCGAVWTFVATSFFFACINRFLVIEGDIKLTSFENFTSGTNLLLTLVLLVLCSIADTPFLLKEGVEFSARDLASFPSYLTFSWANHLAYQGWRNVLGYDDVMSGLADANKAKFLGPVMRKQLIRRNEFDAGHNRGVVFAIIRTFHTHLLHTAFFKLLSDLMVFLEPFLLKWLMLHLMDNDDERNWQGYIICFLVLISSVGTNFADKIHSDSANILGIRVRTALRTNVYRKSLTIRNIARSESAVNEMVNLVPKDTEVIRKLMPVLHSSWTAVVQVVMTLTLLFQELGLSAFAGFTIAVFAIILNLVVLQEREEAEKKRAKKKDKKIKSLKEILSGMKVMKLYAWEKAFMTAVNRLRVKELEFVRKITHYSAVSSSIWYLSPVLMSLISFVTFVLVDDGFSLLDPAKVFFCLSLFIILMRALRDWIQFMDCAVDSFGAFGRLNEYFSEDDIKRYVRRDEDVAAIRLDDATLAWEEEEKCYSDFRLSGTMSVTPGSLIAIVGAKGSGKSSLVNAILGEMELIDGAVSVSSNIRKIAYVPQEPWVQNDTIRENILFGREYHDVHYRMIIKLCELESDMRQMSIGNDTEVGSTGVKLAMNQKQKLAIARAVYSDADLFILDDPFAGMHHSTTRNIFDNLLNPRSGLLKGKTRILVTSSTFLLPEVDRIYVMKHGNIFESGSFRDLTAYTGAFTTWLKEVSGHEEGLERLSVRRSRSLRRRNSVVDDRISYFEEIAGKGFGRRVGREAPDTPNAFMDRCDLLMKSLNRRNSNVHFSIEDYKSTRRESAWQNNRLSRFLSFIRRIKMLKLVIALLFAHQLFEAAANIWLYRWSDDTLVFHHLTNNTNATVLDYEKSLRQLRLTVFAGLGLAATFAMIIGSLLLAEGMIGSAVRVHKELIHRILKSPVLFFERTPASKIVERFLKDMDIIDTAMFTPIVTMAGSSLQILTACLIIAFAVPFFLLVLLPLAAVFVIVERLYIASVQQLRRLDEATCSVLTTEFSETLKGVSTIRAHNGVERFISDSEQRIDENQVCSLNHSDLCQWAMMRIDLMGNLCVFFTTLLVVISGSDLDIGLAGLAVLYSMQVARILNSFVAAALDIESSAESVTRVISYPNHESEGKWTEDREIRLPKKWPNNGSIDFVDYTGQDLVLKNMTIQIQPREKIGVWGKTPASKIAMKQALLRIVEPASGCIVIDGMNISRIGLHNLRARIAVVSADPQLFPGTLRKNLDPFDKFSDIQLWDCLELVHLKDFVDGLDGQLSHKITNGKSQMMNVKHRKLICLARALLRRTKVLLVEESDQMDWDSDLLIQTTIKEHFSDYTVITITNRMHAILDCKRVLLLEEGRVLEFDNPSRLLADRTSIFHALASEAGLV